ncbi:glutathione S-transferase family protein [Thalassotalea ganghwensis]
MYTLVTIPGTCSSGIHMLLNMLSIDAEIANRDDISNYQQRVPTNQVPALIDGEKVITEGAAIILYLFEQHQIAHDLYGSKADFYQWLMFNYATLHPSYSKIFTAQRLMQEGKEKSQFLNQLAQSTASTWQIIDARLAKSPYLAGEKISVLDYLLAIYVNWGNYFPEIDIPLGDNVKRLINQVSQDPIFVETFNKEGVSFNLPKGA